MKLKGQKTAIFVLEDDNEIMFHALNDEDFDEENKQMNLELIKEHIRIILKLEKNKDLTREELILIRDANEIHVNDTDNYNEHHKDAIKLDKEISDLIKQKGGKTK